MNANTKMRTFTFSRKLAERAGRARKKTPCASQFTWFGKTITVAHRTYEDHYEVYENDRHLASFTDSGRKLIVTHTTPGLKVRDTR